MSNQEDAIKGFSEMIAKNCAGLIEVVIEKRVRIYAEHLVKMMHEDNNKNNELKKSIFENMDALEGNAPEFLSNDSLGILHDMNDKTDFLLELYQVESVKYINEWKKLNLKKEHKSV